jgi:hypothetical protein
VTTVRAGAFGPFPLELERPLWRLTLHRRDFSGLSWLRDTGLGELPDARSRRLELALNAHGTLTFTVPGESDGAAGIQELTTEVAAWRWNDATGAWALMFRGVVAQTQDTISENGVYSLNVTCHDYFAMLERRYITSPIGVTYTQQDQDAIVTALYTLAMQGVTSSGQAMTPGATLPLTPQRVNPDGTNRANNSGRLRDRTYEGNKAIGEAISELAAVIDGFDFDVQASGDVNGTDFLRIFYPSQGVDRPDLVLAYGSTVKTVERSVNSTSYANYVRVLGGGATTDSGPQLYAERWNPDANDVTRIPVGLWQSTDNASDVTVQSSLNDKAAGDLEQMGLLVPTYSLGIAPGWWVPGSPAMGDTVPLVIKKGRLNVSTTVRVIGINYAIGDDGDEDLELTVGRPRVALTGMFRTMQRDVNALARR